MGRSSLRHFVVAAGAHSLVCLAFLNYFRRTFALSPWLLAVHLPLLLFAIGVGAAIASAIIAMPWLRDRRGSAYLAATVPAAILTMLFILYAANFASNLWLGVNVTHTLAALWLNDWRRGGQLLPLTTGVTTTATIAIAAVLVVEIMIWSRTLRRSPLRLPRSGPAIAASVAVLVAYAGLFQQLSWRTPSSALLSADPILAFMRSHVDVVDQRQQEIFDQLQREEPLRRAAYRAPTTFERKNVIVIIVDSLRADHMQVYGYSRPTTPFLSSLVESGKLRRVSIATSTCAESNCGILSTLFSKTLRHQVPEDFSLFKLLKDQGYDTHFVLSGNHNWQGLREMYGEEHTSYFDGRDSTRYGWSDDRVLLEGFDRLPAVSRPSFFYFHLMSVHLLGFKQDRYRVYQPAAVKNNWQALFRGDYDRDSVTNNYDNGIVQADATIKELFDALDRRGVLRNSIVAILADHGESLGERGDRNYGHVTSLHQELIRIPLLFYDDTPAEYRGLDFGTQLDVAPTIVDRLGLPIPDGWEGVSLLEAAASRQTMHQTTLATPCFAIVDHDASRLLKYMHCSIGRREEVYDLAADPAERHNLIESVDAGVLERFRAALESWRSR